MKINQVYVCSICGASYSTAKEAKSCESRSISEDKGMKVGDQVLITSGAGLGRQATVMSIGICDKEWDRYWHTTYITVKLVDYPGSRILLYDQYNLVD